MAAVVRSRIAVVLIVAHGIHAACAFKRDGELGAFLSNRSGTTENLFAASGNLDGFLAGLFVVIMAGAAAEIVRRRAYEFFYYVHQLFVVALYFSFAHSKWAFYLGIGPLALHAVDRAVRWWRSRQPAELRKVRVLPAGRDRSLIELTIHAPHVCAGAAGAATGPEPGSYVFLNVPSLALLEWHPFSVSSAPRNANGANANEFMLHVLAYHAPLDGGVGTGMGADLLNGGGGNSGGRSENSFSALLAHWANDTDLHAALTTPIRVDGPYGALAMRDWRDNYSHLLFCGGGSGVAPLMAMVSELLRLHAERRLPHVQSVHLIWVASSIDPIRDWFPQQLRDIRRAGAPFELHLHDTNSRGKSIDIVRSHSGPDLMYTQLRDMEGNGGGGGGGVGGMQSTPVDDISRLPIMTGRPDFAEYFAQVGSWKLSGDNVGVFSCGPPSMLDSVRVAGAAAGFAVHEEVFEW